jgi:hypothetical protein
LSVEPPTVLIVAAHFPPASLASVHRPRHLAKHLSAFGWRPVVVSVDPSFYTERLDRQLSTLLPSDLVQIKAGAAPAALTGLIGLGDIGLRAYRPLRSAIDQAFALHAPSVVLMTGFPFYQMLLAGHIRRRYGAPVVVDFQDPWVSPFGAAQGAFSKAGLAHRLAVWLEPKVLRNAAFVTGVSETQNADMAARYPWLDRERMAAIPIGGDPDDFLAVRESAPAAPSDRIELRYVGAYWPRAEPCVRQLMRGLALLRERDPAAAARLRLTFTGTYSAALEGQAAPRPVQAIAEQENVGELVREDPDRAPFLQALSLMATAPGLILFGSDEPHYTASKIYPVLMSGRPYLSLFHARSSAHKVLTAAGGGLAVGFDDSAALDQTTATIAEGLKRLAASPESFGKPDPAAYAPYTAKAVTGRFAAIFDRLTGGKG